MRKLTLTLLFFSFLFNLKAQVIINEASNRNYKQLIDEDGDNEDWIELYNTSNQAVNLEGWKLSDSRNNPNKWVFEDITIPANGYLVVFASEKDRKQYTTTLKWESPVLPDDQFKYLIPNESTPTDWTQPTFNDSLWLTGSAGFGYGDNDDTTVLPEQSLVVFLRKTFIVSDTSAIQAAILNIDYDDGFVAYLNGVEIARMNVDGNPNWNTPATQNHEAVMYSGGKPETFSLNSDLLKKTLQLGTNVLCISAHNLATTSTDFSVIPYLSFQLLGNQTYYRTAPNWLTSSTSSGLLHTNFKIDSKGERIFLSDTSTLVDSMRIPEMQIDQSFGRTTDGATTTGVFITATPGASNNSSTAYTEGYSTKPDFSQKAGFYASTVELTISTTDENATISYTTNGSEPNETSTKYTKPLKITSTKSIKARAYVAGKLPSEVRTATYFINQEFTVPVLSVTTNSTNLWGNEGIFTNWEKSWNIPSYVEYFEKDKQLAWKQWAGMQVDGGAGGSRSLEQHSFRIEPGNSTLGEGDLKYKLMHRRPNRSSFASFYVRNGSNQHLVLPYKDALEVTALGRNTYAYYSAYQPMVVFINGEYFGVYEMREKINDDYFTNNYQLDVDSLDLLGVSYFKGLTMGDQKLFATKGSIEPFLADLSRSQQLDNKSASYVSEIGKFLDIQSYTDYIIAESWVGNNDWPFNNIKLFRCKGTDMKWRWAINDMEWALMPNGWTNSSFDHIQLLLNQGGWSNYTGFWYNMMQSSDYKAYFINRFADLMNTNYLFSEIGPLEQEMYDEIFPEMKGEFTRWRNSNVAGQLKTFTTNHNTFRSELEKRSGFVRKHLQNHFGLSKQVTVKLEVEPEGAGSIQISTIVPDRYPWEGIYFSNVDIEVTALPNLGYQFSKWNTNALVKDIYQQTAKGKFTNSDIVIRAYFEPTTNSEEGVVISEVNFKSAKDNDNPDWLEFCNLTNETVNLKGWYFTDEDTAHVFTFENDTYLETNKRLIVSNYRENFNALYPNVNHYKGEFNFGLASPSDEINLYNDKKEKIFSFRYNDNYPWPLSNDVSGRTMELRSPNADLNLPSAWFKGCIGGSPGAAYSPCAEESTVSTQRIKFNDLDISVYPNPASDYINIDLFMEDDVDYCDAKIYSVTGSLLKTTTMGHLKSGWNSATIELNGLNENLLILKVSTNKNEKVTKVVKLK
jgi:hypothetical protein